MMNPAQAQRDTPVGGWKSYQSHRKGIATCIRKQHLFMVSDVGLVRFDTTNRSFSYLTRINGLKGNKPTTLFYDKASDFVFIGYEDGLIEYFRDFDNENTKLIADIYVNTTVINKRINGFAARNGFLYIYTGFGVVLYDINRRQTRFNYSKIGDNAAERPIQHLTFTQDSIWVVVEGGGLYAAALNHPNLADASAWGKISGTNGLPATTNTITALYADTRGIFCAVGDLLWQRKANAQTWETVKNTTTAPATELRGRIAAVGGSVYGIVIAVNDQVYLLEGDRTQLLFWLNAPTHFSEDPNGVWGCVSDALNGMRIYRIGEFVAQSATALPNNLCQDIAVGNNQLYIASNGVGNNWSCTEDRSGVYYRVLSDTTWRVISPLNNGFDAARLPRSFGRVHYDKIRNRAWVGSCDYGLAAIENGKVVGTYDNSNTCLTGVFADEKGNELFIRAMGIATDAAGNVWTAQNGSPQNLNVLQNGDSLPNGNCFAFSPLGRPVRCAALEIDDWGTKWVAIDRLGVLLFQDNGTLNTRTDDISRLLTEGANNGNLPTSFINVIRKDLKGAIWVGSAAGVTVFYNPNATLRGNAGGDGVCPVFNQRCLLRDENVTCIAVDGANRKWIGTKGNGCFLISADGTQQVTRFTIDNSPLPSNDILDIEIDGQTGEVFFATEAGVVSYMGSATEGKNSSSDLEVFPNPVYANFNGVITLRGMVSDATVQVTDAAGLLVRALKSTGGQVNWDGKDTNGNKVAPGVYFFMVAAQDGSNAGIAKVAILDANR